MAPLPVGQVDVALVAELRRENCVKRRKLAEVFCLARFVDRLLVDRPAKESFATLTSLNMDDIGLVDRCIADSRGAKKSESIP